MDKTDGETEIAFYFQAGTCKHSYRFMCDKKLKCTGTSFQFAEIS